jgi:ribose transport system permease protein
MVTLSSLLFFSAFAVWLTRSENVTALPDEYIAVGKSNLVRGVSYAMLLAIAVAVLVHLTLSRTTYGRWLYSVGANPRAAFVAGVPTARVITAAYTISGACAALSGLLYSTRLEAGRPTLNADLLLDVIGASVIGGVSLFGGKGKVAGAAIGVLFFVLLSNTLNLMQLPFYVVMIVKGVVIAAAAFLDVVRLQTRGAET